MFLGLGANLGNREETIRKAIALIGERIGSVVRQSSLYYSEPWGFASANRFVNAVVCSHTRLAPAEVLKATQRIERELGKDSSHATQRGQDAQAAAYHDRPIDIDILLYDNLTIDTPKLKIPHPLMQERDFVMIPLKEILETTCADPEPSQ